MCHNYKFLIKKPLFNTFNFLTITYFSFVANNFFTFVSFLKYGLLEITNHSSGLKAQMNFKAAGWFGKGKFFL